MPRLLKNARASSDLPPAKWWPPRQGQSEQQVVIYALGDAKAWVRWHSGTLWCIRLIEGVQLRYPQAYWAMTGLSVAVDATELTL